MSPTDRIEKRITLRAPIARVWRAISDTAQFGAWFGVKLDRPFAAGEAVTGVFEGHFDEAELIAHQQRLGLKPSKIRPPAPHAVFCTVERIEPERYLSFRWIPYGIDAECDPKDEPTTLVELQLEPTHHGTLLTIVESGFDRVPAHRRARAFMMNEGGWTAQLDNIKRYVEAA
ncbi:MAG: SRPBCC family protein [Kofleriaceae bacterium]